MPASPQLQANQARVGRIVGLSLAGLWLAVSMLAAVAGTIEAEQSAASASAGAALTASVVPVTN